MDISEAMLVQTFVTQTAIERFNVCILVWLAGLDQAQRHTVVVRPVEHRSAGKFLAVIGADDFRIAAPLADPAENANQVIATKGMFRMDNDRFVSAVFDDPQALDSRRPTS